MLTIVILNRQDYVVRRKIYVIFALSEFAGLARIHFPYHRTRQEWLKFGPFLRHKLNHELAMILIAKPLLGLFYFLLFERREFLCVHRYCIEHGRTNERRDASSFRNREALLSSFAVNSD